MNVTSNNVLFGAAAVGRAVAVEAPGPIDEDEGLLMG